MRRVLVVNDDREMAGALSQYLAADGYTVQIATDSENGGTSAQGLEAASILLDVKSPQYVGVGIDSEDKNAYSRRV